MIVRYYLFFVIIIIPLQKITLKVLYGKKLRIAFDAFIRPEIKFASLDILKTQIQKDDTHL